MSGRVDQGMKRAMQLATAVLDGTDLGDLAIGRRRSRCLKVEHAERHLEERRTEVVECLLRAEHQASSRRELIEQMFVTEDTTHL